MKCVLILLVISTCIWFSFSEEEIGEDLYKLLNISRDASLKDIRQAFKKLAVKLHPDKNPFIKDADEKFTKVVKAYETLKDPVKRKRYDLFGDIDNKHQKSDYESYTYYRDQFGIYDDDPIIITLTISDFELNVIDDSQIWFVNFYSAHCHHCHDLKPIWKRLASELEGVIRVGAVNCMDDWALCRQLNVNSYPTLLLFGKDAGIYEGIKFKGQRTFSDLQSFVLSRLAVEIQQLSPEKWEQEGQRKQSWLLLLCPDSGSSCPEPDTRKKLAAIFDGLIPVGVITDKKLSSDIYADHEQNAAVFWKVESSDHHEGFTKVAVHNIAGSDAQEITQKVLELLPNPDTLTEEGFRDARTQLRLGAETPWLICFYIGAATELNLQLKRLPMWLPHIKFGLIHCGKSAKLCNSLHVSHYPAWGMLKAGGAFELHHGRDALHEIVAFARESSKSTNLHALSPAEFYNIIKEGSTWFIDWYAPWCPPCMKLLPELRKASQHFTPENIQFGTIDCTLHSSLCSYEGVRAYPTTRLYNGTKVHHFNGVPNAQGIVEFVQHVLNPIVISLDESSFAHLIRKPKDELWIVDYFAPWCGPCQRLAPHWNNLAKDFQYMENIKVAQVDCEANGELCGAQNVRAYPTIRLYPMGSKGLNTVAMYEGHFDAASLKKWLLSFLPSSVRRLSPDHFRREILSNREDYSPWIVDFFAPWCPHCTNFEPEFVSAVQKLEGKVQSGKMDCEKNSAFCREMRIKSYPTVMLYLSPHERHEITTQRASEIVEEVNKVLSKRVRDEL